VGRTTRWWRGRAECELSEDVPAEPALVRAFYADLHNIVELHPLVVSVHVTERTPLPDGYRQTYRVRDRVPLGPFELPIGYVARLTVPSAGDIHTEARQFPAVRLTGVVAFDATDAGTRVTERITIEAPRPLAVLTTREAVATHREMLAGLRRHFGS